jgi:phosphoribosylanthranilate isomerase
MTAEEIADVKKEAQEQYLAVAFLLNADHVQYRRLIEDLEIDYLQGQGNYPKTVTAAYNVLMN